MQDDLSVYEYLSQKVIFNAKKEVLLNLRFFGMSLSVVKEETSYNCREEISGFAIDGKTFYYNPKYLLRYYDSGLSVERALVHSLLHCLFRHDKKGVLKENFLAWSVSCDIAVENVIDSFNLPVFSKQRQKEREKVYRKLEEKVKILNAERIYKVLCKSSTEALLQLNESFYLDEHVFWDREIKPREKELEVLGIAGWKEKQSNIDWEEISARMLIDVQAFSTDSQAQTQVLIKNLTLSQEKQYDFNKFLSDFLNVKERVSQSQDEFDYVYYCYGLNLYKNMPLIENLEYTEERRLEEVAIVIDTSGSTMGDLVKKFLQKVYDLISQTTLNYSDSKIYIIQCDDKVREFKQINGYEDFAKYMENFTLIGGGGTDFRQAFKYIEEKESQGEIKKLNGLIYFTDGNGRYPEVAPTYKTAFVFYDDLRNNYDVPMWACKLVIDEEDL